MTSLFAWVDRELQQQSCGFHHIAAYRQLLVILPFILLGSTAACFRLGLDSAATPPDGDIPVDGDISVDGDPPVDSDNLADGDHLADGDAPPFATMMTEPGTLFEGGDNSAICSDDRGIALAWVAFPPSETERSLFFARMGWDGEVLIPRKRLIPVAGPVSFTALFASEAGYTLWFQIEENSSPLDVLLLSADGSVVEEKRPGQSGASPWVVEHDGGFAQFSHLFNDGAGQIYMQPFEHSGERAGDQLVLGLAEPSVWRTDACAAWTGSSFAVVWKESSSGRRRIRQAFADIDGTMTESRELFDTGTDQQNPMVVMSSSGQLLVTWQEADGLAFLALGIDGSPAWTTPVFHVPPNTDDYMNYNLSPGPMDITVIWESDATTLLRQVHLGWIDLNDPLFFSPVLLSDPNYHFSSPEVAGEEVLATVFRGEIGGSGALFFKLVDREP